MNKFKTKYTFETRTKLCNNILEQHPNRIPAIVTANSKVKLDRNKFLIPSEISFGVFLIEIRKHTILLPEEAIYLFCGDKNVMIPICNTMQDIYNKYKDADGFLYIYLAVENTFGTY